MKKMIPKDEIANETDHSGAESLEDADKHETEEIVLYDECGDTLWDKVLRQEENKLQLSLKPHV